MKKRSVIKGNLSFIVQLVLDNFSNFRYSLVLKVPGPIPDWTITTVKNLRTVHTKTNERNQK